MFTYKGQIFVVGGRPFGSSAQQNGAVAILKKDRNYRLEEHLTAMLSLISLLSLLN